MNRFPAPRVSAEGFTSTAERGWWPGNATDPNPTLNGVTQRTYDRFRAARGEPVQGVELMSPDEQTAIYDQYWHDGRCDLIATVAPAAAIVHFDAYFNGGGVHILQVSVDVPLDGIVGPQTLQAVEKIVTGAGEEALVMALLQNRLSYLQALENWPAWGKVWSRRENRLAALIGVPWTVPTE